MKPKTYALIQQCVDAGVARGLYRAYKHQDNPDNEYITQTIQECVMQEICEWFSFDDNDLGI